MVLVCSQQHEEMALERLCDQLHPVIIEHPALGMRE